MYALVKMLSKSQYNTCHVALYGAIAQSHLDISNIDMDDNPMYKNMMSTGMCNRYIFIAI